MQMSWWPVRLFRNPYSNTAFPEAGIDGGHFSEGVDRQKDASPCTKGCITSILERPPLSAAVQTPSQSGEDLQPLTPQGRDHGGKLHCAQL